MTTEVLFDVRADWRRLMNWMMLGDRIMVDERHGIEAPPDAFLIDPGKFSSPLELRDWLRQKPIRGKLRLMARIGQIDWGLRIERRVVGLVVSFTDPVDAVECRMRW